MQKAFVPVVLEGDRVPTRDHQMAKQSKNYRYTTNRQGVADADTRLAAPVSGNQTTAVGHRILRSSTSEALNLRFRRMSPDPG